ncbi:MAG: hypothetical protein ACPGWR_18885 [Ardenticatenaceae bacterium]
MGRKFAYQPTLRQAQGSLTFILKRESYLIAIPNPPTHQPTNPLTHVATLAWRTH